VLEHAFMQRALAAALGIGVVCGALGFFVVLRRLAFVGVGISHAAVGGVALGLLLGVPPLAAGGAFGVAVALGISATSRTSRLGQDTVIGVFFSGAMALGLALASAGRGVPQDLFGYLFGNVLAIGPRELVALGALAALVAAGLAATFRAQLLVAFDEELARAYGHRVGLLDALLLVLLALTVVIGVRLVGVLLVEALLVVPAATAALWATHYRARLALSIALGAGAGALGLALAWQLDLAVGATVALVAVAAFFASFALRRSRS
jgi:zinc transport system permease protein